MKHKKMILRLRKGVRHCTQVLALARGNKAVQLELKELKSALQKWKDSAPPPMMGPDAAESAELERLKQERGLMESTEVKGPYEVVMAADYMRHLDGSRACSHKPSKKNQTGFTCTPEANEEVLSPEHHELYKKDAVSS